MKAFAARIGRPKPDKRRKENRGEKPYQGPKWAVQHAKAACSGGKLFGFAIELASYHQVKPNRNRPLID
ncbi:TPA: hypothetical protein P2Q98_004164 [Aeromonas veronii]|uniref:hypothetical protein n=1 Tax=Aeromonas veronii TaxID=654 RepID=UPI0033105935|nr:hypothetical protein [Aeromonas veronii]HDO1335918.1 hypothetical protein [Aeromonas veronii]HDO1340405.1 hypothetical protein [Aeromonas veronii]HDO1344910.1 hypothetical protein [Aeromonas veronii]HDO1363141.1 hypothetical protein [Aeromonas veronii]